MPQEVTKKVRYINLILSGMIVSVLLSVIDFTFDIKRILMVDVGFTWDDFAHLTFEGTSIVALSGGMFLILQKFKTLLWSHTKVQTNIIALRVDFASLVSSKFKLWNFSEAEVDIGILLLKGLSLVEISKIRKTSNGTVKVQSHNAFKKSGVNSRAEFMSYFIEEFMDIKTE